jgi:cell division transport system permease protein
MKVGSMSTTEQDVAAGASESAVGFVEVDAGAEELPRFESSIVPSATVAGRSLIAVVAIMTFLGSLTTGGVMLVRAAANDWQSQIGREVTIQVRPVAGRDIDADVVSAAGVARAAPGIAAVRPYSKEESARLLQPWLGGLALDELPVPRIIAVEIAPGSAPDLARLRAALAQQVPPATLDDHREFVDSMRAVTRAAVGGGLAVLALVFVSTILSVTFATRGTMAANRDVIEVLHFIGAKTGFIAQHFQRHFLLLGLEGGAIGGGAAIVLFVLVDWGRGWLFGGRADAPVSALLGAYAIGIGGYAAVLAEIVLIAAVTAATSRRTVHRTLKSIR